MKLLFSALFLSLIVFTSCATPPKAVNKEKFGAQSPDIWMPMNEFEMNTIIKAKAGLDEMTKFKLALLFTGSTRTEEEFANAWKIYSDFISKCDNQIKNTKDIKEKGKILHEMFFNTFIKTKRPEGYQSSGIEGLIIKHEYDMNSAALLFGLTAQRYGFSTEFSISKGDKDVIKSKRTKLSMEVITGSIYTTISHPDLDGTINIFPLWENGFDITLNLDFFKKLKKDNPLSVKSAEIEFERYQKRRKTTLDKALLLQYKTDKAYEVVDLDFAPGFRRIEMAAQLTDSCEVLIDRAWVWREIYSLLHSVWEEGEMLPFIELIEVELERTRKLCETDKMFKKVAGSLYLFGATEYAKSGNGEKLKTAIAKAYSFIDTQDKNYKNSRSWLLNSVHNYLDLIIEKGLIEKEVDNVNMIINSIPDNKTKKDVLAVFYYHAGQSFFKKEDYWKAGYFNSKCAEIGESSYFKTCVGNGAIAYLNYSIYALNDGKCSKAKKGLKTCNEKFPDSEICKKIADLVEDNCN